LAKFRHLEKLNLFANFQIFQRVQNEHILAYFLNKLVVFSTFWTPCLLIKSKVTELKPVAELLPLSGSLGLAQNNDVLPKKGKKGHSSEWRTANIWANQDKRLSGMDKDLS
jgi:hypothetical protein